MYFKFCKPSILKWQYGIYAFIYFKFITGLWHPSFYFTRNYLLTNFRFDGWTFLMAPFFNISFTSNFTNSWPSRLTNGWEGIFEWKGFKWNEIWYPFTISKILGSCVIFMQVSTKCFNLFCEWNVWNTFWKKYSLYQWVNFFWFPLNWFSGFKSMLKKNRIGIVINTISLLLTPCLSAVGMTLLLLLLVTIMEFFRSGFCEKKLLPLTFSRCAWGAKWKWLFVFYKNLFGLFLRLDCISNMVP